MIGMQAFYVEGISNPKLEVGDLRSVAAFSKDNSLTSVIDATFTPPINFRPASIGFDVVLHSATKYANGHSDIVAGIVAGSSSFIAKVSDTACHYFHLFTAMWEEKRRKRMSFCGQWPLPRQRFLVFCLTSLQRVSALPSI